MKTREEAAKFINKQLSENMTDEAWEAKDHCTHYGRYELRSLMDYIFEGKPSSDAGCICAKEGM